MIKVYNNSTDQINASLLSLNNSSIAVEEEIRKTIASNNKVIENIKAEIITNNSNINNKAMEETTERLNNLINATTTETKGDAGLMLTKFRQTNGIIQLGQPSTEQSSSWTFLPKHNYKHIEANVTTSGITWLNITIPARNYFLVKTNMGGCLIAQTWANLTRHKLCNSTYLVPNYTRSVSGLINGDAPVFNNIGFIGSSNSLATFDIFFSSLWE